MSRLTHLFAVLPLAALLGGCGPVDEEEQGFGETEPQLGTSTQELTASGAYSWTAPADATSMGTTSGRACFFDRIRGRFDASSDYVRIFASGGSWYLYGGSRDFTDKQATARCVLLPAGASVSAEYEWTADRELPVNMGTASGRVCLLTYVSGDFDGSSDWVRAYTSGGSWFLFGSSSKATGRARARCIPVSTYSGEYTWSSSQSYDTHMGTTSGRFCALTYVGGALNTMSDYVDIYTAAGSWYLGGNGASGTVHARARCF